MSEFYAVPLLVLGVLLSTLNWYSILSARRQGRHVSPVPLLGGILLFIGLLILERTRSFAWLGLLADYGTLSTFWALPKLVGELWRTSHFNLVHRFVAEQAGRRDDIRLFKGGVCTIRTEYMPPVPCNREGALVQSFGFVGHWQAVGDGFRLDGYRDARTLEIHKSNAGYVTTETGYPPDREFPYDAYDLRELMKAK